MSDDAGIDGLSLDDAVEAVAARTEEDRETIRSVLFHVADDGVVGRDAAEDRLAHVSKVVSTAETRTELASIALSDAREAAEPVADLDCVRSRLEGYESEVGGVEDRAARLGDELGAVADPTGDADLYEVATDLDNVTAAANAVQRAADELNVQLEEFQHWLSDPDARFEELEEDLEATDASLDDLAESIDDVAAGAPEDPGLAWARIGLRHRSLSLAVDDIRAELADLRTWAERDSEDVSDRAGQLDDRISAVEDRHRRLGNRLTDLGRPDWRERFGDQLREFDDRIEEFEPPIEWGAVQEAIEECRSRLEN